MQLRKLETALDKIYRILVNDEVLANTIASTVHRQYRLSAKNLYRYILLRSHDIRTIQGGLSELGISSLGSGAGYVSHNISSALRLIKLLRDKKWERNADMEIIGFAKSKKLLQKHANILFRSEKKLHDTQVMVTMPDEAAHDKELLKRLMNSGMEIARINLSHGDQELWDKTLHNLHTVSSQLEIPITIYMDLPGPKIRTTSIYAKEKSKSGLFLAESLKISTNDHLLLRKDKAEQQTDNLRLLQSNVPIVCVSLPQIIDDLKVGQRVFFDDGTIEALAIEKSADGVLLEIMNAYKKKLASAKGINLPDTHLNLPSLTPEDLELLPFVTKNADLIGYSFVRNAEDVATLYGELQKADDSKTGVIFKIENVEAFENLPAILFQAMKRPKIGVMIARGDLAVELGFDRISEVQNQIMLFCEAAHVPVIWATQVLDNLAKKGIATRAEISDVTISAQAECVMLNKGPYIVEAVETLKNILQRMATHTQKKKNTLRTLKVAKANLRKLTKEYMPTRTLSP